MDDELLALIDRLGADAVRNSDGTELPEVVKHLATKVYETYFVGRGDQQWALSHRDQTTRVYLMSRRVAAIGSGPLDIEVAAGYFAAQVAPDTDCDVARWWQVIDRTTGKTLPADQWNLAGAGAQAHVIVARPEPGHLYTVDFLAQQLWDPTQMYNYLTNNWADDPTRVREQPYDVRYPETWEHIKESLARWLDDHEDVDVVRFTTFFYHFTLVYSDLEREGYVDWFGYTGSVSVPAMEAFEAEVGYALVAEDFVDEGYYNSSFRVPTVRFLDWIGFMNRFVTDHVRELVSMVHASGKEAMMFLGDNWIGTEPYGPHYASTGMDAVVGSVGSAATCRMISDIPGVKYTEGRFLPYFFPDVFRPGGDPVTEANQCWVTARRAIVRSPLDRIGYGGYPSVAMQFPAFLNRIEQIIAEFRQIHDRTRGATPIASPKRIGVLNAWGALRSWQTHMVAHAMWYRHAHSYLGVLESLAGLPFDVTFLSFDDIAAGVPDSVSVLVNAGAMGTAFSGGVWWADPAIQASVRTFVGRGGGLIGVGDPSAHAGNGACFQLSDVLGLDRELGYSLSTNREPLSVAEHFITADVAGQSFDAGESTPAVVSVARDLQPLALDAGGDITMAAHEFGAGRAVYFSGLPWSAQNNRLLHRALHWSAHDETTFSQSMADDPRVEVAQWGDGAVLAYSMAFEPVTTVVHAGDRSWTVDLPEQGYVWLS
jgi:1,3-beta-galactosyl-N-acetylhexosamine phosphorylase